MNELNDDLSFVCHGKTGTVHVIAASSSDMGCDPDRAWPMSVQTEFAEMGPVWALATMPVLALCGWVGKTAPKFDDYCTDCFADEKLCQKCCRALGDQSHRAFEHPQPS
jgi:hypothetical protein